MLPDEQSFVVPENQDAAELVSLLKNNFPVRLLPETATSRVFYDTFDWRLYKNGSVLEKHEEGASRKIYWRPGRQGKLKIQLGLRKVPQLAGELAGGEFRQQLLSVISVRELIPRIKIRIKRQPIAVLGNNEKVVVRLSLDKYLYSPSKTRAARLLGQRLTLKPVKGYLNDFRQVEALLQPLKLYPAQDNMMKLALIAKGVSAGEYTTKMNTMLDPEMPAEQALKQILRHLLEVLQQNTAGSIKGIDTEYMHDYRVSIRKTRSALKQVNSVLPGDVSTKFTEFFSMLGKLTNPVRDLDVLLRKLEAYQRELSKAERKQLKVLRDYLAAAREKAQEKFVEFLKSSEYRESIKQWHDYLDSSATENLSAENAGRPVYKLANELIWEVYQQAIEQGNAIVDDSEAETLHELRKTFKKLRYLIEFFRSLYPTQTLREITHALTALQDNLGDFNDLDVHIGIIKGFIKQCDNEDTVNACEQIIATLDQQLRSIRAEFAHYYAVFYSTDNHDKFREMFIDYHQGQ